MLSCEFKHTALGSVKADNICSAEPRLIRREERLLITQLSGAGREICKDNGVWQIPLSGRSARCSNLDTAPQLMRSSSEALLQVALFLRRAWREQLLVSPLSSEGLILGKLIPYSPLLALCSSCKLGTVASPLNRNFHGEHRLLASSCAASLRRGEVGLFRVARRRRNRAVVSTKLWLADSEAFVAR